MRSPRRVESQRATGCADIARASLRLLTRAYCHLCADMRAALEPIAAQAGVAIVEIDVDAHPALEIQFGARVPVLLYADHELCHYTLDVQRVREALARGS